MTDGVKLTLSELAIFHSLERRERDAKNRLQTILRAVAIDAELMMKRLSKKHDVNLYEYEINWKTGECRRKLLPQLPKGAHDVRRQIN